jgi:hypothetical protein
MITTATAQAARHIRSPSKAHSYDVRQISNQSHDAAASSAAADPGMPAQDICLIPNQAAVADTHQKRQAQEQVLSSHHTYYTAQNKPTSHTITLHPPYNHHVHRRRCISNAAVATAPAADGHIPHILAKS